MASPMSSGKVHPKDAPVDGDPTTSVHDRESDPESKQAWKDGSPTARPATSAEPAVKQHVSFPRFLIFAKNYHGTTEFWWQALRWLLAMGIIILQQSSGSCVGCGCG